MKNNDQETVINDSSNSSNENDQEKPLDLRATTLGAMDGLLSTASIMLGVGAVKHDVNMMILTGFAGLLAGACSMAIAEFVSVYAQHDIQLADMKRGSEREGDKEKLPSPTLAAATSWLAFFVGALVPLLAAMFVKEYKVRIGAIVAAVTLALVMLGWMVAFLGKAPVRRLLVRVVIGGLLALAITFGLTKLFGLKKGL